MLDSSNRDLRHASTTRFIINGFVGYSRAVNSAGDTLRKVPCHHPEVVPREVKRMDVQIAVFRDSRGIERTMEIISSTGNTKMLTPHRTQLVTLSGSRMVRDTRNDQRFTLQPDDTFQDEFGNTWTLKY
jgi:hypothetical protein